MVAAPCNDPAERKKMGSLLDLLPHSPFGLRVHGSQLRVAYLSALSHLTAPGSNQQTIL